MESIPARETRLFVQRVFENFWIYRARLGQETPTLTALAAGRWPAYVALDGARFGVAEERPE
jgi:soluble lytic murein transglycosylase